MADDWDLESHETLVGAVRSRTARIHELTGALRALIDIDPLVPSEVDSSLSCNYCCEYQPGDGRDRHRDTCPWVRAVKLLGEPR